MNINENQAIKFLGENEETFNNEQICGCDNSEKFSYLFTDGDTIDFQIDGTCEDGEDLIVNGSFEEGESETSITSWARDVTNEEQTRVTRVIDNTAPCGAYVAKWANENPTPNFAQLEQNYTFVQGRSYKVTLKAKIVASGANVGNILEIIAGGISYYITPTASWAEYELIITFNSAPSTPYFQIKMNETPTDVSEMYVDCVSMVELGECCVFNHVNNGCFELGAEATEDSAVVLDNWTLGSNATLDPTGGLDGSQCLLFAGVGDTAEQECLVEGRNIISFWARSPVAGSVLRLTTETSSTILGNISLTTDYVQYTYDINTSDTAIKFEAISDEQMFIDCVETYFVPQINITIIGEDVAIVVNPNVATVYDGYINVSIPIDDYDFPECFQICVETCLGNLFLNPDFELGSGNLFTYWTLTQPSRTNYCFYSQDFTNWASDNVTITSNFDIAPDGSMTADRIVFDAGVNAYVISNTASGLIVGNDYITHIWLKSNSPTTIRIVDGFTGTGSTVNITTEWQQFSIVLIANGGGQVAFQIDNYTGGLGQVARDIIAWQGQIEDGLFITPTILTTNVAVTTSLGEFLQHATGGLNGTRCIRMWVDNGGVTPELSQSVDLVDGVGYTISFWAKLDLEYGEDELIANGTSILIDSVEWKYYETTFTQSGSGSIPIEFLYRNIANYGFISLDDIYIFETGSIDQTCSENMKYVADLNPCTKELVWYDNRPVSSGINYASGFKNRVRVNANLNNPQYNIVTYVKNINDGVSKINRVQIKKNRDLAMQAMPEFLLDRVVGLISVSNIEYGGVELCSTDETEISVQTNKDSRLYDCTITLAPKEEYLINTSYNCS